MYFCLILIWFSTFQSVFEIQRVLGKLLYEMKDVEIKNVNLSSFQFQIMVIIIIIIIIIICNAPFT